MPHLPLKALAIAACLSVAGAAEAAIVSFDTSLSGANEAPPNGSPASGNVLVSVDDILGTMSVSVNFTGLIGNSTAAHIHCCSPVGVNSGVAVGMTGFPVGVTSGAYGHVFLLTDPATYSAGFLAANGGTAAGAQAGLLAALNGGNAYFNLHTQTYPGGEIRGQFALIPEPGTWALMITGFGLAGLAIRRRRAVLAA